MKGTGPKSWWKGNIDGRKGAPNNRARLAAVGCLRPTQGPGWASGNQPHRSRSGSVAAKLATHCLFERHLERKFFAVAQDADFKHIAALVPGHQGHVAFEILHRLAGQFHNSIALLKTRFGSRPPFEDAAD